MIKRSAARVDVESVSTTPAKALPPFPNPPLSANPPLFPKTGWRWPWLLAALALMFAAGALLLTALPMAIQLGTSDDEQYTGWVGAPRAEGYLLALLVALVALVVLCFRRWRPWTRNVIVAACALLGVAIGSLGLQESAARRHVGPALVAAVNGVSRPAGATSSGPAVLESGAPAAYLDLLGEPWADRKWLLATGTEAQACAAERQMLVGTSGWEPWGLCGFRRSAGRVVVIISADALSSSPATIDVSAYPND